MGQRERLAGRLLLRWREKGLQRQAVRFLTPRCKQVGAQQFVDATQSGEC
ncbi:hypothetical protein A8926_4906 [Saccharopolyspora spinosa]|uniref:Uncharacterized protein n=1 Tax=Saccharopolyspora spinosa TaxID=60894 RepID=A0A2N3Y2B8_SACSN|nr:hypothetical protein A8926_4906 [Saccharopolyspora spinosa]